MKKQIAVSTTYNDIAINTFASLVKSALLLLSIRLGSEILAPAVFGLVMFARRTSATAANLTQLGVSQAIQRYVPMHEADLSYKGRICGSVLTIIITVTVSSGIITALGANFIGSIVYPKQSDSTSLLLATYLLMIGFSLSYVVYSFMLAEFKFVWGNVFEFFSSVGIFLIIILFSVDSSSTELFWWLSVLTFIWSAFCLFYFIYSHWSLSDIVAGLFSGRMVRRLLGFGVPRGVSAMLDMMTLLIGPWMLRAEPMKAGALIVALTLVRAFQAIVAPASRVMGLHAVRSLGRKQSNQTDKSVLTILVVSIVVAFIVSVIVYIAKDVFVSLLVGNSEMTDFTEKNMVALLPFIPTITGYYFLRNVVELRWRFPFNLLFLIITLSLSYVAGLYLSFIGYASSQTAIISVQIIFSAFGVYTLVFGCFIGRTFFKTIWK
jgi:O-antigen/teichoic acid export membrane protein